MANDLTTSAPERPAFSAQSLTPSTAAVLDRAFEAGAHFTADEVALVAPIASAVATVSLADEGTIRKSVGSLAAVLPSKDMGEAGERLRLNVYVTMLAGCDERALAHACRRCLDELDWMPTIHQLKERLQGWVSPEAVAISKAKHVLRAPRVAAEAEAAVPDPAEILRMNDFLRRHGLATRFANDLSTYQEPEAATAEAQGEGVAA